MLSVERLTVCFGDHRAVDGVDLSVDDGEIVAVLGPSLRNLFIALTLSGWTSFARLVRGEILVVRELEFVASIPKTLSGKILRRELIEQERAKNKS